MKQILFVLSLVTLSVFTARCPADEYCLRCVTNGDTQNCASCAESYAADGICTAPTTKIDNCWDYETATTCLNCKLGYQLNTAKTACTEITIDNCERVSDGKCVQCEDEKLLEVTTTANTCTDTDCASISNCDKVYCSKSGTVTVTMCGECDDDYAANATATGCVSNSNDCAVLDTDGKCTLCKRGYYWVSNVECKESST